MIVEITAVPELECAAAEHSARGVSVTPVFWNPKELTNVASIIVKTAQGKIAYRGMIRVSGNTGRPSIALQTDPVIPAVDRTKK
jgi:hypothetical protein